MWRRPKARFDSACAISQGARDTQEDAIAVDFPVASDTGFAVLADGMGGHSAGEIASRYLVTVMYSALKFEVEQYEADPSALPAIMSRGLKDANAAVRDHVRQNPRLHGMGSTLVSLAVVENRAHWLSVGDSPLYLLRRNRLLRLNENHAFSSDLDKLVEAGTIGAEEAQSHPDRDALTSAVIGVPIPHVDCPDDPLKLYAGDILLLASDGLQYLEDHHIARLMTKHRRKSAADIATRLMAAIDRLNDPDQDNVALSVIKVNHAESSSALARSFRPKFRTSRAAAPGETSIAAQ